MKELAIPKLREVEVEVGRGKTVAEAVKKIGVTEQMEQAATPVTVTRRVLPGNGGRQSSVASGSLLTIPIQPPP